MATLEEKVQKYEDMLKLLANTSIAGYLRSLPKTEGDEPTMEVTLTNCDITGFAKLENLLKNQGIKLQSETL
jgi:hypothetical protein